MKQEPGNASSQESPSFSRGEKVKGFSLEQNVDQLSQSGDGQYTPQSDGLSCTFLMWVVQTVHTAGWGAAIAIVAATGAAGAAALLLMYPLGASGFLAYVSSRC